MEKLRKILTIVFVVLLPAFIILAVLDDYQKINWLPGRVFLGLALVNFILLFFVTWSNKGFYNFSIWMISILLIDLFLRINRWQGTPIILLLTSLFYAFGLIIISFRSIYVFKNNRYIQLTGFFASFIIAMSLVGLILKILHAPGANKIGITSATLFILFIVALMFTLPNVNYLKWTNMAKKFLFRSIIIPLIFIFLLYTFVMVFPSIFEGSKTDAYIKELKMKELILKEKEGI